jgi:hypothetical protein
MFFAVVDQSTCLSLRHPTQVFEIESPTTPAASGTVSDCVRSAVVPSATVESRDATVEPGDAKTLHPINQSALKYFYRDTYWPGTACTCNGKFLVDSSTYRDAGGGKGGARYCYDIV